MWPLYSWCVCLFFFVVGIFNNVFSEIVGLLMKILCMILAEFHSYIHTTREEQWRQIRGVYDWVISIFTIGLFYDGFFIPCHYQWHSSHCYSPNMNSYNNNKGEKIPNNFVECFYVVGVHGFVLWIPVYIYSKFKCIFIEFIGIYYPSGLGRPTDRQQQQQQKHHRPSS